MTRRLLFFDGSPFARICRVLALEWGVDLSLEEFHEFPLPEEIFDYSPLGQVPVLIDGGRPIFPTIAILAHLSENARQDFNLQSVAVALQMGDALVSANYQRWAGLEASKDDRLGFDPASRNMERVFRSLDWFEPSISVEKISVVGVAVATFLLWSESRAPFEWRGRPRIERLVGWMGARPSFQATKPRPWTG